jgi:hydrogenase maturation protease
MIKLIAIGNILMGDDGVAIYIARELEEKLKNKGIEVIIGETDFQYCLDRIEEKDNIILLDATCFGIQPGSVTVESIRDVYKWNSKQSLFSQHGYSLIGALKHYYKNLEGLVVGVEGSSFDFGLSLSRSIEKVFQNICGEVENICTNKY